MDIQFLVVVAAATLIIVGAIVVLKHFASLGKKKSKTPYNRQAGFLQPHELKLFNMLVEVCGSRYLVFPQVHLGRLLEVKPTVDWKEKSNQRSRVDRKPADFIICSKEGTALAVVETGGDTHNFPDKKSRDKFLDDLAQVEGLPLVHLNSGMSTDAVRAELERVIEL